MSNTREKTSFSNKELKDIKTRYGNTLAKLAPKMFQRIKNDSQGMIRRNVMGRVHTGLQALRLHNNSGRASAAYKDYIATGGMSHEAALRKLAEIKGGKLNELRKHAELTGHLPEMLEGVYGHYSLLKKHPHVMNRLKSFTNNFPVMLEGSKIEPQPPIGNGLFTSVALDLVGISNGDMTDAVEVKASILKSKAVQYMRTHPEQQSRTNQESVTDVEIQALANVFMFNFGLYKEVQPGQFHFYKAILPSPFVRRKAKVMRAKSRFILLNMSTRDNGVPHYDLLIPERHVNSQDHGPGMIMPPPRSLSSPVKPAGGFVTSAVMTIITSAAITIVRLIATS